MTIEVLTISTKGQVVLPKEIRDSMNIKPGDKVVAYYSNGSLVIKALELPTKNEFEKAIKETMKFAKEEKITKEDIDSAIKEIRNKR